MMVLGLDLGAKRTGLALGDGQVAQEYTTLATDKQFINRLKTICRDERVERLVIGLPIKEDGQPSAQTEWVRVMGQQIETALQLPVVYTNEVLTSVEARRQLEQQALAAAEIDSRVDQLSARLILEQTFYQQAGGQ